MLSKIAHPYSLYMLAGQLRFLQAKRLIRLMSVNVLCMYNKAQSWANYLLTYGANLEIL